MAGILDVIKLYRGEAPSRSKINFGENRGNYFTQLKDYARHFAQGGSQSQGKLIKDLGGKVKSLTIPKKLYEKLGGGGSQVIIKDPKLLNAAKTDVLQTFLAKAGSFTPLATKALSFLGTLSGQAALMALTPTKMGNAELRPEDFKQLNDEEMNYKLEEIAKENNIEMGSMDKSIETISKDI